MKLTGKIQNKDADRPPCSARSVLCLICGRHQLNCLSVYHTEWGAGALLLLPLVFSRVASVRQCIFVPAHYGETPKERTSEPER